MRARPDQFMLEGVRREIHAEMLRRIRVGELRGDLAFDLQRAMLEQSTDRSLSKERRKRAAEIVAALAAYQPS